MRVTWIQPEDLVGHELRQAREEGKDVGRDRGALARGRRLAGAAARRVAGAGLRASCAALALELLDELAALPRPLADRRARGLRRDPRRGRPGAGARSRRRRGADRGRLARPRGRLRARQAGRGPRRARASARSREAAGNWPVAAGSPREACRPTCSSAGRGTARAARRASPRTSTARPEDDDLNFTMLGVALLERCGTRLRRARRGEALARLPAARPDLHRRARRDAEPPARACCRRRRPTLPQPVPRVDRRAAARRRLRLGRRRRPGARGADGVGGRAREPHRERRLRGDVHGGGARGLARPRRRRRPRPTPASRSCPRYSRLAEALLDGARARRAARVGGGRRRALRALRRAPLGARDQQHGARRRGALRASTATSRARSARSSQGGWDTDTNGAAVGSVLGAIVGPAGIDERWTAPLRDRIASSLPGLRREHDRRARTADARGRSPPSQSRDAPGRGAARPARPAADRPADGRAARARRRPRGARRRQDPRRARRPGRLARLARGARALARRGARRASATTAARTTPGSPGRSAASRSRSSGSGTSCSTTTRARRFTPDRLLAEAEREFGGFDGDRALARLSR